MHRKFLWMWSHLLIKSLMENFIFCAKCIQKSSNVCMCLTKLCVLLHDNTNIQVFKNIHGKGNTQTFPIVNLHLQEKWIPHKWFYLSQWGVFLVIKCAFNDQPSHSFLTVHPWYKSISCVILPSLEIFFLGRNKKNKKCDKLGKFYDVHISRV